MITNEARWVGTMVVASAVLVATPAGARELHVVADAVPGGTGTSDSPFATLPDGVAALTPGDELIIHEGIYELAEPLTVTVVGTADAPILIRGEGTVTLEDPTHSLPDWTGALEIVDAAFVTVQGLRIENAGFFGIRVENSDQVVIEDCATHFSDGSGIYVGRSRDVVVRRSEVSRCCEGDSSKTNAQECVSIVNTDRFEVEHVEVFDSLRGETGGEGIDVKEGSKNGSVHHCTIHDVVRLGLYVDAWDKLTENIELYSNEIYHSHAGISIASEAGGTVRNVRVHDNLVWENGRQFVTESEYWEYDGGSGISIPGYSDNGPREEIDVYNNTVVNNAGTTVWGLGIEISTDNVTGLVIRDNVVVGNAASQIDLESSADVMITHNLIYPFHGYDWTHEVTGDAAIELDPVFEDPSAQNFRLTADSPAIDAGLGGDPIGEADFDGNVRIVGAAIDVGAFEFGSYPLDAGGAGGADNQGGASSLAGSFSTIGGAPDTGASARSDSGCGCRSTETKPSFAALLLALGGSAAFARRRGIGRQRRRS